MPSPYHKEYRDAHNAALTEARATGSDHGIEKCDPRLTGGNYRVFRLPKPEFRSGHELRCEVVRPTDPFSHPATLKATLVERKDGQWLTAEFAAADLIPEMAARGFKHTGFNTNASQRAELQGQPKFAGLLGPMWGGDHLRYENQAAYDELSI